MGHSQSFETIKGIIFVVITTIIIFFTIRFYGRKVHLITSEKGKTEEKLKKEKQRVYDIQTLLKFYLIRYLTTPLSEWLFSVKMIY